MNAAVKPDLINVKATFALRDTDACSSMDNCPDKEASDGRRGLPHIKDKTGVRLARQLRQKTVGMDWPRYL